MQPSVLQLGHVGHGHPEGGDQDDIARLELLDLLAAAVAAVEELHPQLDELLVHLGVVDDLVGDVDVPVGMDLEGLVGVLDGALDPVAEAHLAGHVQGKVAELQAEVVGLDAADNIAVVEIIRQLLADGRLVAKSLAVQFAHLQFVKSRTNLTTTGTLRN
jgi:hypothetical protein